ncbi:MAG: RcnB family protein [Brevundimonas sp.]|uniref:RcnB family protein n=1 Tax=Brevundimonas sp. TaxID=1871086 RepID=UPI002488ADB1|nr:RcnB family protein [Brevundimonas sp.]MDI1326672.1 RcnB family protein [Brevundimonas sp.]
MKKLLTAAIAATLAMSSLGVASAAEAQSRGQHEHRQNGHDDRRDDRNDRREDRREDRRDDRNDRREWRQEAREDRRDARQQQRAYARWQRAERRYSAGRYQAPRGYQTRPWAYGQSMPSSYRSSQYVVNDYGRYGLRAPPRGYQYVRSGNDVILSNSNNGLIAAVIASLFN